MSALILGLISGMIFGFTGSGGGIIATPFLMYGLGMSVHNAIGITLLTLSTTAITGLVQRFRSKIIDWQAGLIISFFGLFSSALGSYFKYTMPAKLLTILLALLFVIISILVWINSSKISVPDLSIPKRKRYIVLASIGIVAGFLNGLFGISGGVIIVPTLTLLLSYTMLQASAVSILVISIISTISSVIHFYLISSSEWNKALSFVIGSMVGMIIASRYANKLSDKLLKRMLATLIFGVGVSMFINSFFYS
jgi:uncharacterized membrane protein YfcA